MVVKMFTLVWVIRLTDHINVSEEDNIHLQTATEDGRRIFLRKTATHIPDYSA